MVYLEYEEIIKRYQLLLDRYNRLLIRKEEIFTKTLPSGIRYDKDHVQSSATNNMLDEYIISLDESQIDEALAKTKDLIEARLKLIGMKEKQLRMSRDKDDKIYVMKYLDGKDTGEICEKTSYSRSQIYNILHQMSYKIEKIGRKWTRLDKIGQNRN